MGAPSEPPGTRPPRSRWVDRHQSLAAALIVMFFMFSPAVDLRPKPLHPAQYEMAEPSDPPDLDLNLLKGDEAQGKATVIEETTAAPGLPSSLIAGPSMSQG